MSWPAAAPHRSSARSCSEATHEGACSRARALHTHRHAATDQGIHPCRFRFTKPANHTTARQRGDRAMLVRVTATGSPTQSTDHVATDLRRYLEQVAKAPDPVATADRTRSSYADSAEQPGQWSVRALNTSASQATSTARRSWPDETRTLERDWSAAGRAHPAVGHHSQINDDGRRR